ncbi:RNA polymerase sigma-70 factor [Puteibacter caeruleilacunae]|nr:RNA polymerase sigma-70 factor [Puteibacter caeruleilacunae]
MDIQQFKYFYNEFFPVLAMFAQKYVGESELAEDMAQEAFITFWNNQNEESNPAMIKSFLYTTTRNNCLNYLKHNKIKKEYEGQLIQSEAFFKDAIIEQETSAMIWKAIEKLAPQSRKVVEMSMTGMKNPEIALQLDVSVNTVKTLKSNAYKALKNDLKDAALSAVFTLLILQN